MQCERDDCDAGNPEGLYYESRSGNRHGWVCIACIIRLGDYGQKISRMLIHKDDKEKVKAARSGRGTIGLV